MTQVMDDQIFYDLALLAFQRCQQVFEDVTQPDDEQRAAIFIVIAADFFRGAEVMGMSRKAAMEMLLDTVAQFEKTDGGSDGLA